MHPVFPFVCFWISVITQAYDYIEKGDSCQKLNGQFGTCIHFNDCPSAIEAVRTRQYPEICSFEGIYPIVCCPDVPAKNLELKERLGDEDSNQSGSDLPFDVRSGDVGSKLNIDESDVSLRKCRDYQLLKQDILRNASEDVSQLIQYSHMALLGYVEEDNRILWKCVGSLISETFVLTSARCTKPRLLGRLKYVQLGQQGINSNFTDAKSQNFVVKATYVHPDFQYLSVNNDLGLIELGKPAEFTEFVSPACLPVNQNIENIQLEATGYGLLQSYEKLDSNRLQVNPGENCKEVYEPSIQNNQLLCTEITPAEDGRCYVDVGAPLLLTNTAYEFGNFSEIRGIYLFGSSCNQAGDIFLNLVPYKSWIEKIVWSST